jgi:short-subunit dehydrogenase
MPTRFQNQVVFITGASSGIGAAAARAFAAEGAKVALLARRTDRLADVQRDIQQRGGEALAIAGDVTDPAALARAVAETVARFGKIDVVLANAGFGVSGPAWSLTVDDYRRQFETNFFGLINTVEVTLPQLRETKGRLGLVASIMGRQGSPAYTAYCASKFAIVGYAESLYYDLAEIGVSVTLINPGIVESEIRSVNNTGHYTGKPDPAPSWIIVSAASAAREIVRALHRRKPEVTLTGHGKIMMFITRHFPRATRLALRTASKGRLQKMHETRRGK